MDLNAVVPAVSEKPLLEDVPNLIVNNVDYSVHCTVWVLQKAFCNGIQLLRNFILFDIKSYYNDDFRKIKWKWRCWL